MDNDSKDEVGWSWTAFFSELFDAAGISVMSLTRLMILTSLIFFGVVTWKTLSQTPAFNPNLVSDTIIGQGRTYHSRFMYDLGEYEFQRGYGFLVNIYENPGAGPRYTDIASDGALLFRALKAEEALENAIRLDPRNAHAWESLAWARARLNNTAGALDAMRVSWELAPYNFHLASRRVNLVGLVTLPGGLVVELSDGDRAALAKDVAVLRRFDEKKLREFEERFPHFF